MTRWFLIVLLSSTVLASACSETSPGPTASEEGLSRLEPAQETGTIQIIQGGTGRGTVTSVPAGIDCTLGNGPTGTCEATFPAGTRVKLKADAADGSRFEGWAPVNSCPKPKSFRVEAGRTHECQPVFSFREPPELLLQVGFEGSGRITSSPEGIDCTFDSDAGTLTGQCGNTFLNGTTVTLTATPLAGWAFVSWSGEDRDCEDGVVTMEEAKRCIANFVRAAG